MLSERMQILVSRDQRRRLEEEAKRRGTSVGSLVREAIDASFSGFSREERIRAVEELRAMKGGRFVTPEELNRIVEEEREAALGPFPRRRTK